MMRVMRRNGEFIMSILCGARGLYNEDYAWVIEKWGIYMRGS